MNRQYPNFHPRHSLQLLKEIYGRELMQRKVVCLFKRQCIHIELEDIPGLPVRLGDSVYDNYSPRLSGSKQEIEQEIPNAGAHIQSVGVIRENIMPIEIIDHLRTKAVIAEQDIAAAENQEGF